MRALARNLDRFVVRLIRTYVLFPVLLAVHEAVVQEAREKMSDPDPDRHWGDRRVKDGLQQLRLHQLFQHRLSELKVKN